MDSGSHERTSFPRLTRGPVPLHGTDKVAAFLERALVNTNKVNFDISRKHFVLNYCSKILPGNASFLEKLFIK